MISFPTLSLENFSYLSDDNCIDTRIKDTKECAMKLKI